MSVGSEREERRVQEREQVDLLLGEFGREIGLAGLALDGDRLTAAKIGTLCGSAVSAALGSVLLLLFLRGERAADHEEQAGAASGERAVVHKP